MFGFGAVARVFLGAGAGAAGRRADAVGRIAALEPWAEALTDDEMRAETLKMKAAASGGTALTGALGAKAFALVREAAKRVLGQRPYDVQVLGGLVLTEGKIAEMRTGEGKTLVAALPTFLVALEGKGVHVVTVNDYLARRDSRIVGRVHEFLGLTVGVVVPGMTDDEKRAAYACDVTYGTNSEIGFDYLRDNLRFDPAQMVQRGHHYAIVDEVDSILIDEARTPLIISGPAEDAADMYRAVDSIVPRLGKEDVSVDEKLRTATLTEVGNERVEAMLAEIGVMPEGGELYDGPNSHLVHHVHQALKAHLLFRRDKDYIVKDGEIVIVDEFTGRSMAGRRFSEGLHQALEAKEGVAVQPESQTLSSITYQNLFRMYSRLSGMTGTATTEAEEFGDIYGLEVVTVPTHRPVARIDEDDEVHANAASKYAAIAKAVSEAHAAGQPVLIGTSSIEKSETVAAVLERVGFRRRSHDAPVGEAAASDGTPTFQVLNARHHAHEALIVSMAGAPGAVTIATNMAGRGTDIQLGGSVEMRVASEIGAMPEGPERDAAEAAIEVDVRHSRDAAIAAGGLLVIGTERHESRRIDNQLRGRSGRQGDPGRSRFYVSMDDDIARIFGSERMARILPSLGLADGEAIVHPWISKALEKAQKKVESSHYDTRKNLIKYDDVTNEQRKAMFSYRKEMMSGEGVYDIVEGMREDCVDAMVARRIPANSYPEQWDADGLRADALAILNLDLPVAEWFAEEGVDETDVKARINAAAEGILVAVEDVLGREVVVHVRKSVLLEKFDKVWREHLSALEHLRSVVGFRSYAQRDPIVEYRTDAYNMFLETVDELSREVTSLAMRLRPAEAPAAEAA